MKRLSLKNITMVFVIIAAFVYINNSLGIINYVVETSKDLMSMWLVTMYVDGRIDTLRITDKSEVEMLEKDAIKWSNGFLFRYLNKTPKDAHLKVILKNSSSKKLSVQCGINFYDENDDLLLEEYPLSFTWLNGGEVDTLWAEYFTLPQNQIKLIKRYELKVFYYKVNKRQTGFR